LNLSSCYPNRPAAYSLLKDFSIPGFIMPRPIFSPIKERLSAIAPQDYSPEQSRAADALIATPRGEVRGPFIPLLRSPELLDRSQKLGEYLRYRCTVPERLREFAILVTARHWHQPYEWYAHVGLAIKAGVAPETLEALAEGEPLDTATPDEAVIHEFVIRLHGEHFVDDALFAAIRDFLGEQAVVDLTGLCGYYAMLAMMMNVAGTSSPDTEFSVPR
jgi:4-carboxymuconolactone decarboxylase